jgi:hypothetical protein
LNGDRKVESMRRIAAGGWWGHRGRVEEAGKEGICSKKEWRKEVGKGREA